MAFTPKIGLAAFYHSVMKTRGFTLAPHHLPLVAALEDFRIDSVLFLGPPGTGKTTLLCTVYAGWTLGHDPTETILAVSAGEKLPQTFLSATMQLIQNNKVWHELFPDVQPAQDLGWSLQRGLFVTGHHPEDENASYMACGLASKALTGLHCRTMILDDIHDRENSGTAEARANVKQAYYDTLMGRADPRGIRRVAAGRWWAEDDLYQELIQNGDWVVMQLPATRPGSRRLWYDVSVPRVEKGGPAMSCVFSEKGILDDVQDPDSPYLRYRYYYGAVDPTGEGFYWPASSSKRREFQTIQRRTPRTAAVNYNGNMQGASEGVFQDSDFTVYPPPLGLEFGLASPDVRAFCAASKGDIVQAWDTAFGQVQSEALTVALTGLLVPCKRWHRGEDESVVGEADFHFDVYLLHCMADNLDFGQLGKELRNQNGLWSPREVVVEEKASGISLLQVFKSSTIPLKPQKVHQGKLERALNPVEADGQPLPGGAASVQGWARQGRVFVPAGALWVGPFLKKVLAYKGGVRAVDEFDALVHLVTRAILRSRRRSLMGGSTAAQSPAEAAAQPTPAMQAFGLFAAQQADPYGNGIVNPFEGFCGGGCHYYGVVNNKEWCGLHSRVTSAISGCTGWARKGSVREPVHSDAWDERA
jgi:hypothetical protein